jgi:F0F1-type ATP synthase membrane subunit b/b'
VGEQDRYQRPPLRYQRFGGGFRRQDVEFALAELRLTMRQLDSALESLRARNRELERELQEARATIESSRGKEHEVSQAMSVALRRAADIEDAAIARAREITAQAEESAARIRSDANRRVETSSAQFNELLRLKDDLFDAMRSVVGDFDQAISRAERGEDIFPAEAPGTARAAPEPPAAEPRPEARPPLPPDTVSIPPMRTDAGEILFGTHVELDAGPFPDFTTLSAFERSLAHVQGIQDIHVRKVADDRALIELALGEPAPLLRTLEEALPYLLQVRSADGEKLVVDVAAHAPTAR